MPNAREPSGAVGVVSAGAAGAASCAKAGTLAKAAKATAASLKVRIIMTFVRLLGVPTIASVSRSRPNKGHHAKLHCSKDKVLTARFVTYLQQFLAAG